MTIALFSIGLLHSCLYFIPHWLINVYRLNNAAKKSYQYILPSGLLYLGLFTLVSIMSGATWAILPNIFYASLLLYTQIRILPKSKALIEIPEEFQLSTNLRKQLKTLNILFIVNFAITLIIIDLSMR